MKKLLLVLTLALCAPITFAQNIPSYVPTEGLVGYWPFNGNANDESVNGNNGTVNGAILSSDRFGNLNAAYSFDGIDDWILIENQEQFNFNNRFTINAWINTNTVLGTKKIVTKLQNCDDSYILQLTDGQIDFELAQGCGNWISYNNFQENLLNNWHVLTATFDIDSALVKLYFDGGLISEQARDSQVTSSSANLVFGNFFNNGVYPDQLFFGLIDDIAIYNRALTQEEISALYQGCALSITTQPTNQTANISNNAQFTVVSSDPDATYQWQTDLGVGFQNISNAGQYTGATTSALTIANTTLSNNNQLFRCVIAKASCTDTSSVATLNVNEAIPSNVPTDGLVGYWPFNGNANDQSGNGNNGTVNGATLTTDRNGNENSAYSFDGLNDFINTPTNNFPSNER